VWLGERRNGTADHGNAADHGNVVRPPSGSTAVVAAMAGSVISHGKGRAAARCLHPLPSGVPRSGAHVACEEVS
jgi:hypothetical protein